MSENQNENTKPRDAKGVESSDLLAVLIRRLVEETVMGDPTICEEEWTEISDILNDAVMPLILENKRLKTDLEFWRKMSSQEMRLRCGEMSAQEIRTVRAVLDTILSANAHADSSAVDSNRQGAESVVGPSARLGPSRTVMGPRGFQIQGKSTGRQFHLNNDHE